MFRELVNIFRSGSPLSAMGDNFARMLKLSYDITVKAGEIYFEDSTTAEDRTYIYKQDVDVNKLERTIRKQVVSHLSMAGNAPSVPYCLLLMSLVKDVERIGDYAKNLAEIHDVSPNPLPDDELVAELREIRIVVEGAFEATSRVFSKSDHERATELIRQGQDIARRCDALVGKVARASYNASTTTALVLGARYYKRINGHLLNVLSSVVMPLHKLDYYDEKEMPQTVGEAIR